MCFLVQNNPRSRRGCAAGIIVEPQVSGDLVGLLAGALALDYWWLADSRLVNAWRSKGVIRSELFKMM